MLDEESHKARDAVLAIGKFSDLQCIRDVLPDALDPSCAGNISSDNHQIRYAAVSLCDAEPNASMSCRVFFSSLGFAED